MISPGKKVKTILSGVFFCILLNVSFVQAASIVPSIEITGGESNVCTNHTFAIPVFYNITNNSSDSSVMSVQGVGTVSTFSENNSLLYGAFGYAFTPTPYNVAVGTPVTITITTYNGQNQTGGISYISTIVFACDTGNVISLQSGPPTTNVPTMTEWGMIIFMVLAGLGSVYYLSRQKRTNN